jgi:hypothetical protein
MLSTGMRAPGDHEDVPHALLPLTLAVGLVRNKIYNDRSLTDQGREGDLNMLANLIAEVVPLYEYSIDPSRLPRALRRHELVGGLFRDGAKELRFIDGRAPLRHMAVNATDLECVLALLREPERAARIRARFVRRRAQKIRARSELLLAQAAALRHAAKQFRSGTEEEETPLSSAA